MKICSKCKIEKDESEFYNSAKNKDHLHSQCKGCGRVKGRKYAKENNWRLKLWREYCLTVGQYELMLKAQNGVCKICGKPEIKMQHGKIQRLSVDHDHKTFKIRGLLCYTCNQHLGSLEKDNWLEKAIAYLEEKP